MSLLIGLPFNQLSSVSSVSAGIENIGGVYADGSDVEFSCGSRLICLPSSLETWAADASGAVDGLDEHAANANATAAPMIVTVIVLVMVFMFFSFFKNKSYNESE